VLKHVTSFVRKTKTVFSGLSPFPANKLHWREPIGTGRDKARAH
jgi:hypothetical protein